MLVRRMGQPWGAPDTQRCDDEAALQQLISDSPDLVARDNAEQAVALREFTIPSAGSMDVLLVHADGAHDGTAHNAITNAIERLIAEPHGGTP